MLNQTAPLPLREPSPLRQNCADGGQWLDAAIGKTAAAIRQPPCGRGA